jgi:hypothetical protein
MHQLQRYHIEGMASNERLKGESQTLRLKMRGRQFTGRSIAMIAWESIVANMKKIFKDGHWKELEAN